TRNAEKIRRLWGPWPHAWVGMPTGRISGRWVLDIDVKRPEANGFDSLVDIGLSVLPETPMVHTPSGGLHVYFDAGERELRCSAGVLDRHWRTLFDGRSHAGASRNARGSAVPHCAEHRVRFCPQPVAGRACAPACRRAFGIGRGRDGAGRVFGEQ